MSYRESDHGFDSGRINGIWQAEGNCAGVHPETMWPLPASTVAVARARLVCVGCPSRLECLRAGAASGEWDSVRGSLTGEERAALHRDGVPLEQYPQWTAPIQTRICYRCRGEFVVGDSPRARLCLDCAGQSLHPYMNNPSPCTGCGTTRPSARRKGLCDGCYCREWRRVKAASAC